MGTNYYLVDECPHCKRSSWLHIGKQSGGWKFLMHEYPEDGFVDWPTLRKHIEYMRTKHGHKLMNEYGEQVTLQHLDMLVRDGIPMRGKTESHLPYTTLGFVITDHGTYESARVGADDGGGW